MQRNNQLRNQLASTLNPDLIYHIALKHDIQKNPRIQYQEKQCQKTKKINTQTTTQEKGKFLTLVSKPKKSIKRGKSNKKTLLKKSHSVILGGTKQSKKLTNQSEQSFQNSRCKSCTNLHQTNQITTLKTQTNIQTPTNNITTHRNIPMNLITQLNENNLKLTNMINHKLKMDTIQPHQFFTHRVTLNSAEKNNNFGAFDRKLLKNISAGSMDRVYFSVGEDKIQKAKLINDRLNQRIQRRLLTPRFDNTQVKDQRKRRQRAGFIRSASARKASPPQQKNHPSLIEPYKTTQFTLEQQFHPQTIPNQSTPKQQQIDQCITKMSLIRKQIDEIQSMIHQRLQSSQMRTKIMYGSQSSRVVMKQVKNQNQHQTGRLFTHRGEQSVKLENECNSIKNSSNNNNSRLLLAQSRTATIVNDLNNLSRSLSMSKCVLMQSSKIQQRTNIINNDNQQINNNSKSHSTQNKKVQENNIHHKPLQIKQRYQYLTNCDNNINDNNFYSINKNISNNPLNLDEICKLINHPQYPKTNNLLSQQLIEKQYIGQFITQGRTNINNYNNNNNTNSHIVMLKDKLNNQQNTLFTNSNNRNNIVYANNNNHPVIINRLR